MRIKVDVQVQVLRSVDESLKEKGGKNATKMDIKY